MECRVCFDDINTSELVALPCGHIFHTHCVIMLIQKRNRKCPLCREKIPWNKKQLLRHFELSQEKFDITVEICI